MLKPLSLTILSIVITFGLFKYTVHIDAMANELAVYNHSKGLLSDPVIAAIVCTESNSKAVTPRFNRRERTLK